MFMRIFVIFIVLIAFAVVVLALNLPTEQMVKLIFFRDFFDVTLPILAFGALVKYLCSCSICKTCSNKEKKCS